MGWRTMIVKSLDGLKNQRKTRGAPAICEALARCLCSVGGSRGPDALLPEAAIGKIAS
jgi:hypothetical protein